MIRALAAALLLCALASRAAPAQEKKMAQAHESYSLAPGRFRCDLPKSWSRSRDESLDAREKVYGLFLAGPRSAEGLAPKIGVEYYAPGNRLFPRPDDYLKANLEAGPAPVKGERTGPVQRVKVAGRPARRFVRNTFQFLPPESAAPKRVPVTEEVTLVEDATGFFVLTYSAPDSVYKEQRGAYRRVVDTFRPLP